MHYCNPRAPRLLINKELVGLAHWTQGDMGFEFDKENNYRDAAFLGSCDEGILIFAELLGWRDELEALIRQSDPDWMPPTLPSEEEISKLVKRNFRNSMNSGVDDRLEDEDSESGENYQLSRQQYDLVKRMMQGEDVSEVLRKINENSRVSPSDQSDSSEEPPVKKQDRSSSFASDDEVEDESESDDYSNHELVETVLATGDTADNADSTTVSRTLTGDASKEGNEICDENIFTLMQR